MIKTSKISKSERAKRASGNFYIIFENFIFSRSEMRYLNNKKSNFASERKFLTFFHWKPLKIAENLKMLENSTLWGNITFKYFQELQEFSQVSSKGSEWRKFLIFHPLIFLKNGENLKLLEILSEGFLFFHARVSQICINLS